MLISELAEYARQMGSGRMLWDGPEPDAAFSPTDVIALTLHALRFNDRPTADTGTATLRRFSTDGFHFAGTPRGAPPPALSAALNQRTSQYGLLFEDYELSLPSDTVFEGSVAFQEVQLDGVGDGPMLAKLGWELTRSEEDGAWRTSSVAWQDFRDGFRPGIGREEWTRAYG